jgi:hypothetical protein
VAAITSLLVLSDLGEAPLPAAADGPAPPPFEIAVDIPQSGLFTLAVDGADGVRVRNIISRTDRDAGTVVEHWDLKDGTGQLVQPGEYRWKAVIGPPLRLRYEQTVYPNVSVHHPDRSAWFNGHTGPGGWLADHSSPFGVGTGGDYVFFTASVPESGIGFACSDLSGRKLWGIHDFAAWSGGHRVVTDGATAYTEKFGSYGDDAGADRIWAVDIATQKIREVLNIKSNERRSRGIKGMALRDGLLYLSVRARQTWLKNATGYAAVDVRKCVPFYKEARKPKRPYEIVPNPRGDFIRLFRLHGSPPGYGRDHGLTWLESTRGPGRRQHIMLAFTKPTNIGSCIYPVPQRVDYKVRLSFASPAAPYPPDPDNRSHWTPFATHGELAWDIATPPENAVTRALLVTFLKGEEDELADLLEDDTGGGDGLQADDGLGLSRSAWRGRLEGMQILRRRYRNLFGAAEVTVSSGAARADGTWHAQRTDPLSASKPALYMMSWQTPQPIRGLAIKEIDAARTVVEVWTGSGAPQLAATDGWTEAGVFVPRRRMQHPGFSGHNADALYLNGMVDFGETRETRGVRLRMVAQFTTNIREGSCAKGQLGLDPTRCRVFGVAPLAYMGGETPVDPLLSERLEIIDPAKPKMRDRIVRELPITAPGDLDFAPDGTLYGISDGQVKRIDLAGGAHTVFTAEVERPSALAVDRHGAVYVFDSAPARQIVRVFDRAGMHVRDIGTPGGYQVGGWDPMRLQQVQSMAVDREDKLWVVSRTYWPKRVACFKIDGTHLRDYLGPTAYGGGGVLDPYDKRRLVYGPLEFELDWRSGTSRLKNLLSIIPAGNASHSPYGEVHLRYQGHDYFVNRPSYATPVMPAAIVYLYKGDRLQRAAAMGHAEHFSPLRRQDIIDSLGDRLLTEVDFMWSDSDGDGEVDLAEVTFGPRQVQAMTLFNRDLGVQAGPWRYAVDRVLPSGVPVYRLEKTEVGSFRPGKRAGLYRFADGSYYQMGNGFPDTGIAADGSTAWTYPNEGAGVGPDRHCGPFTPSQVVCQIRMAGHEKVAGGELGEVFVNTGNLGNWFVWTSDGLLVSRIMRDLRDRKRFPWAMEAHPRGLDLSDVTGGQEHFVGWFCRTVNEGKYYIVAGHQHASVVEVQGLEDYRRLAGEVTVTAADVRAAMRWEKEHAKATSRRALRVINCYTMPRSPFLPKGGSAWTDIATATIADGVRAWVAYDAKKLYLRYQVSRRGDLVNGGNRWDMMFKSGACLDMMISTDASADPGRRAPVAGDQRILFSRLRGEPIAVLYNAVSAGAPEKDRWQVASPVTSIDFDEVRQLTDVELRYERQMVPPDNTAFAGFVFMAAIPLETIGLVAAPNLRLKADFGYLESDAHGTQVLGRHYWSNTATSTLADAPSEARLEPDMWGWIRFRAQGQGPPGTLSDKPDLLKNIQGDEDDVLDGIELEED